jgi:hypothetical protein
MVCLNSETTLVLDLTFLYHSKVRHTVLRTGSEQSLNRGRVYDGGPKSATKKVARVGRQWPASAEFTGM